MARERLRQSHQVARCRVAHMRLALIVLLLVPALFGLAGPARVSPVRAAGPACATSSHPAGSYRVEVCLATSGGTTVAGNVDVTTTVRAVSGSPAPIRHVQVRYGRGTTGSLATSLLTDYASPWSFVFPTARFVDGVMRLRSDVVFTDGFAPTGPMVQVTLDNDVSVAPGSNGSWNPENGVAGTPFEMAAVGDGAGGLRGATDVANLIDGWDPQMLLYLGDVYNAGTYTEFLNYYRPTLGRFKSETNPVPGNHETGNNYNGYFEYWDSDRYYYTFTAGGWRFYALNSNAAYLGSSGGAAQLSWLRQQLASNTAPCTAVLLHHPRWLPGNTGDPHGLDAIWEVLVDEGVDLALSGHEHNYQRWKALDGDGQPNTQGVTQLIIGTGGHTPQPRVAADSRVIGKAERVFGAMRLVLGSENASFRFISTAGSVLDSGSIACTPVKGAPAITLDKTSSKYNGIVTATLTGFAPNSEVTLRWPRAYEKSKGVFTDEMATGRTNGNGDATIAFRTPLEPLGNYSITATDSDDNSDTVVLRVIPRIMIQPESSGPEGMRARVYYYGYAPGDRVEMRWCNLAGCTASASSYRVVNTITIAENGRGSIIFHVPAGTGVGRHTVIGKVIGVDRSVSTSFTITGLAAAQEPTATPTSTATATTPDVASPEPAATVIATETAVEPATPVNVEAPVDERPPDIPPTAPATEAAPSSTPYAVARTSRSASTVSGTNAVDGDPATVWQTAEGEDPGRVTILTLELEGELPIGEVRILPGAGGLLGQATVETSLDGVTWSYYGEPDPATADDVGWVSVRLRGGTTLEGQARFVRVVFVGTDTERVHGGIAEIEVWPPMRAPI